MVHSCGVVILTVSLVIICVLQENESATKHIPYVLDDEGPKDKFSQLLASVADLNQKRFHVLKNYAVFADYNVGNGFPSHHKKIPIVTANASNDNQIGVDGSLKFDYNLMNPALKTPSQTREIYYTNNNVDESLKYKLHNIFQKANEKVDAENLVRNVETESNEVKINDDTKVNSETYQEKTALRLWSKISKKAIKRCKKACRATYKSVCRDYKCRKSMKKSFKRTCKSKCKEKFQDD